MASDIHNNPDPKPFEDPPPADGGQPNPDPKTWRDWLAASDPLFWSALVIGAVFTGVGILMLNTAAIGINSSRLILCSGLGITFGAFGSTATVNYKGIVVTGVAAIAVVLLLLVDYLSADDYVELEIKGDVRGAQILVEGDQVYPGSQVGRAHKFVVIGRGIRRAHVSVAIESPTMAGETPKETLFDCIDSREIGHYLGSGQVIQWRFDAQKRQIFAGSPEKLIAEAGRCEMVSVNQPLDRILAALAMIAPAHAGEPSVPDLLSDLEMDSAYVRREARSGHRRSGSRRCTATYGSPGELQSFLQGPPRRGRGAVGHGL